ncbi:hypothetical protein YC2023_064630 [Brassica napus]
MTLATHSISFFVPNFMRSDLGEADEAQVVVGVQHARRRVRTNLEKGFHRSPVDFASDVRLTFTNALAYNSKGQDVYKMAEKLLSQFDVWFGPMLKKFEAQQAKKLDSLKPLPTLPLPRAHLLLHRHLPSRWLAKWKHLLRTSQPVNQVEASPLEVGEAPKGRKGKLPKPKAKDPNKREMTMEEKAKLGVNLQELPPEKLGQLIQILKKRTTNLSQDGDEIELDIEELDNETLWELDRFVTNYKKMASKIKRQGFIQNLSTPTRNLLSLNKILQPPFNKPIDDHEIGSNLKQVSSGPISHLNYPSYVEECANACHARKSAPGVQLGLSELQLGVNQRFKSLMFSNP